MVRFGAIVAVAGAALAAVLLLPGLLIGPSLDAAVFAGVADRMKSGATLYVDVWDHKPPGIYLLLLAGQSLLPFLTPWVVSWILSVVAAALNGLMVALICCRIGVSWRGSFLAALVCVALMAQYLVALGGGLTELFAAVPLATALWLLFRTPGWRGFASIGGLVGLALVLSVQVIPAGLLLIVFAVMRARSKPASVLALAAGSSAVAILILGWLGVSGALPAAYDDVVRYGAAYRDTAIRAGFTLTGPVVAWTL